MTIKHIRNADGTRGCIIHSHDPGTNETIYWFRVYDYANRREDDSVPFTDYRILHNDLFVQIDDRDAAFIEIDGNPYLDHDCYDFIEP